MRHSTHMAFSTVSVSYNGNPSASITGLPHLVEGTQTTGVIGFANGAPAYKQFFVENTDNAAGVQLSWTLAWWPRRRSRFWWRGMPSPLSLLIKSGAQVDVIRNRFVEFEYDYSSTPQVGQQSANVVIAAECSRKTAVSTRSLPTARATRSLSARWPFSRSTPYLTHPTSSAAACRRPPGWRHEQGRSHLH